MARFVRAGVAAIEARVRRLWLVSLSIYRGANLARRFLLVSSVSLVAVMFALGQWITMEIVEGVIHSSAARTALFTDSLIEPLVQELAWGAQLSADSRQKLDRLMMPQTAGKPFVAMKIWHGDTIVYSNRPELIGQSFPPSAARSRAADGEVIAKFGTQGDKDDEAESNLNVPILEVHAPVRETGTRRIIALAETYEIASTLESDLKIARLESWLVISAATLAMIAMQFVIVGHGSRTIDAQRQDLRDKIAKLSALLAENEALRHRCYGANRRVTEINERMLRRLGADLHDGPIQLLALTQLRLGCLRDAMQTLSGHADPEMIAETEDDFRAVSEAVSDSLRELRAVSVGLVPPEIERLELDAALRMAASRHQRRSGKEVSCDVAEISVEIPLAIKNCLYRFVQEGLNNAGRHADGVGQGVVARLASGHIEVMVVDAGPGLDPNKTYNGEGGQGLLLLRDRVESLGGTFEVVNRVPAGVCLKARFELQTEHNSLMAASGDDLAAAPSG